MYVLDSLAGKGRDLDMSDDESYNDNASVISNVSCSTSNEERSCKYSINYSITNIDTYLFFHFNNNL